MNKYVVAVSGGVDSVVLLDMLANQKDTDLIVAHFDHGIRDNSVNDTKFVESLAKKYKLPFITKREELGKNASEEMARDRRYDFLRSIAKKNNAQLITAHHADDVIETIVINIIRGTGWRGLAAVDSDVIRPLTNMFKFEIIKYAKNHKLNWREDSTNKTEIYTRNRIRKKTAELDADTKLQILGLWSEQKILKTLIDEEASRLVGDNKNHSRYFFTHLDNKSGVECLRFITEGRLTRPQMQKALHAIKTILPRKKYEAGGGAIINFTSRNFTVELIK